MRQLLWINAVLVIGMSGWFPIATTAGQHSLGGGIHYLITVDDIDTDEFEDDSIGWLASYQFTSGFTTLELDIEYFPDRFAGFEEEVWAPQAFLVLGSYLYAGLGIGSYYDESDWSDPFYILRFGLDLPMSHTWSFDLNVNYQFNDFDQIQDVDEDFDTDTITLGTMIRYRF